MKFLASIFVLALTACSNSGSPYPANNTAAGTPGQQAPGSVVSKQPTQQIPLVGHAWCTPWHNQGTTWQMRFNFINEQDYDSTVYALVNGRRGDAQPQWASHGTYTVDNDVLTARSSDGQTASEIISYDPHDATTGAERLHLGDSAMDPCL